MTFKNGRVCLCHMFALKNKDEKDKLRQGASVSLHEFPAHQF